MAGCEQVHHPYKIKQEDPFQREEGLEACFGCEKPSPGDNDGGEIEGDFGECGGVGWVGEDPDQEGDEEHDLLVGDCARVDGVSKKTDEGQEFHGGKLVLPPFFRHPREGEEEDCCDHDSEDIGCGGAGEKLEENCDVRDCLIGFRVLDQLVVPLDWPGG